jgi:hypothetical protein
MPGSAPKKPNRCREQDAAERQPEVPGIPQLNKNPWLLVNETEARSGFDQDHWRRHGHREGYDEPV